MTNIKLIPGKIYHDEGFYYLILEKKNDRVKAMCLLSGKPGVKYYYQSGAIGEFFESAFNCYVLFDGTIK